MALVPGASPPRRDYSRAGLIAAGVLVGVCGLGRLSLRSLVAVLTFMATAIATTFVVRHLWSAT